MPSHQLISHPLAPVLVRRSQGNFISHTLYPRGEGTRVDPAWECLSPFLGGCYIQPRPNGGNRYIKAGLSGP